MVNEASDIEGIDQEDLHNNDNEYGMGDMVQWGVQLEIQGSEQIVVEASWRKGSTSQWWVLPRTSQGSIMYIKSEIKQHHILGHGRMPGTQADQSAYRSKLFGLWGIIATMQKIVLQHQLKAGRVLIACDGLTTLCQAQSKYPSNPNLAHYELIGAIWQIWQELLIDFTFEHMKGHQDMGTPTALMLLASMNVEMDLAAKRMINKETVGSLWYHIPGELWCCYIEGQWLMRQVATQIHRHISCITIEEHWDKKVHYKEGHKSMIN